MKQSLEVDVQGVKNERRGDGEDEEFPIAGPSFNKYFRNPDFCNEEKWTEAAKVLKAVRKDYMEGE